MNSRIQSNENDVSPYIIRLRTVDSVEAISMESPNIAYFKYGNSFPRSCLSARACAIRKPSPAAPLCKSHTQTQSIAGLTGGS